MKTIIKIQTYSISINLVKHNSFFYFEIIANNLPEKTKSSITNLNFIISELIEPIIQFDDYETIIVVDEKIGKEIYDKSIELFNDLEWINQLIIALNDDRNAGEWQ